jgi:hypothetical protein
MKDYRAFLACSDDELAAVDPLVLNLLVAKSIPSLADLDLAPYVQLRDSWALAVERRIPQLEHHFHRSPDRWKNDVDFFRLGLLCEYLERHVGVAYKEEQRDASTVFYTDPSDLFLNGVMDTRRGSCASMATLHVAVGRKLGWPVSLACVKSHFLCRYDDGRVTHNIEATQSGEGGFKSDPDEYLIQLHQLPAVAITSGSDLRSLTSREMLGVFLSFRARHMRDTGRWQDAERDYLLARHLFPNNRRLYLDAKAASERRAATLFEPRDLPGSAGLRNGAAVADRFGSVGWVFSE